MGHRLPGRRIRNGGDQAGPTDEDAPPVSRTGRVDARTDRTLVPGNGPTRRR
jgi:hypothetical protein